MGRLLVAREVANRLGLTRQTIDNWINRGAIKVKKVGKTRYIDESTVLALQDTAQDIKAQKETLEMLLNELREENKWRESEFYDKKLRGRYYYYAMNMGLKTNFFETILSLLRYCDCINDTDESMLKSFLRGKSIDEISEEKGCTRERVRQKIEKALRKCSKLDTLKSKIEDIKSLEADNIALRQGIERLQKKLQDYEKKEEIKNKESEEEFRQSVLENDDMCKLLLTRVTDFNLSVRALNGCAALGVKTIADLCKLHKTDFLKGYSTGKKTLYEVTEFLNTLNLDWGTDVDAVFEKRLQYYLAQKGEEYDME